MNNVSSKTLTLKKKTAVLTLEMHNGTFEPEKELRALDALLGNYNLQARNIPVDHFHNVQRKFQECIAEIASQIEIPLAGKAVQS